MPPSLPSCWSSRVRATRTRATRTRPTTRSSGRSPSSRARRPGSPPHRAWPPSMASSCRILRSGDEILIPRAVYGGTARPGAQHPRRARGSGTTPSTRPIPPPSRRPSPTHQAAVARDDQQPDHGAWPTSATLAELAHDRGVLVAVDNTFATPALANPLAAGRGRRRPLDHEVHRRPLGPHGRRDRRPARSASPPRARSSSTPAATPRRGRPSSRCAA